MVGNFDPGEDLYIGDLGIKERSSSLFQYLNPPSLLISVIFEG